MERPSPRGSRIGPLFVIGLIAFVAVPGLAGLYLDFRWFASVGFGEILRTQLLTQLALFTGAAVVAGGFLYTNLRLGRRWAAGNQPLYLYDPDGLPRINLGAFVDRLITPASGAIAVLAGLMTYPRWQTWVLAGNATSFGKRDAIFGRDVGFYIFTLPLWDALSGLVLFLFGASTVAVAALYTARGALVVVEGETRIASAARGHLSVLVALVLITLAIRAYLQTFDVMYSTVGPMTGASYADVNAKLPALRLMVAAAAVAAVLVLVSGRRESLSLAFAGVVLYLGAQAVVVFYPGIVHRFSVQPNELEREAAFLKHNIDATRAAYGLDSVTERELSATSSLTAEDIAKNSDTVDNIRLWDHQPLLDAFEQIQEIRSYYDFESVDNDRYMIGGKLRQTMLSARELPSESITNPTWINKHFTYTHGYGIALGPVNEATREGMPVLLVQDIPPVSKVPDDIDVKEPRIYFGEQSSDVVFVRTRGREFDYPSAKEDVKTDYEGKDGIRFDSPLVRAALSISLGSFKVLLSDDIDSDSRVLLHRNVRERLGRIAPFLALERDPYMVVRENGTLVWICDAYTVSDRYPYSEPSQQGVNYIRNSVKAVVDAYDGTVTLYVADAKDPIINAWQRVFPQSFTALAKMPSDLRAHLRYPELAFDIQTEMFATYHMNGSELLYNREDQWEVPVISAGDKKSAMRPYYTVMKLPGEQRSEFILMLPFTPKRKDNLAAWMVARSDGDALGQLIVYRFPKDRLVFGPQQVVTRINQDAEIARQISLWDQRGSKAEFGTLLVVPIEESLLYVRPLYLRSEGGKIPELKRVIVALENQIAMAPSLREAIDAVFKEKTSARVADEAAAAAALPAPPIAAGATAPTAPAVAAVDAKPDTAMPAEQRALVHFERAIAAQRAGDWASYGEELREVEALLRAMQPSSPQN